MPGKEKGSQHPDLRLKRVVIQSWRVSIGQITHKGLKRAKISFHPITPIRTLHALGLDKGQEIFVDLVF
jgi:hypothetical protein